MMNNPKNLLYAVYAVLLLVVIFFAYLLWPRTALTITQFDVYNDVGGYKEYTLKAGECVEYEIWFEKFLDVPVEVTVMLQQIDNGFLSPLGETRITRMPVGKHHYKNSVTIPRATPDGKYVMIRSYRAFISPLKEDTLTVKSDPIYIEGKVESQTKLIEQGNITSRENQLIMKKIEKEMKKK